MKSTKEQLDKIKSDFNTDKLYSWSRINLYETDPYSYLLKYIENIEPDKGDNSYSFLGGRDHSLLESFYKNELTNEDMLLEFENDILVQELTQIKFHVNDDMNNVIKDNYVTCIKHFLREYIKDENVKLEELVYGKIGNGVFIGFVDKIHIKDDFVFIDDYKTSTIYKGEKLNKEKGQLYLYAYLISQMYKIPIEKIRVRWNFLKYATVDYEQINGKIVQTTIKRNELGKTLFAKITTWLKKYGYKEDEIQNYLNEVQRLNEIEYKDMECIKCLPEEIQSKFHIHDAEIEVSISNEDIEEFINIISDKIDIIEAKESLYKETNNKNLFWSTIDEKNSYYFINLCDYSTKYHIPLKKYIEKQENMDKEISLSDDNDIMKKLFFD